jgi:A/G-specific adenine glycosylase
MTNISQPLIEWYSRNKRDLPWRETKIPYNIWVSEIILQQTRVNQGINYYYRFIEKYPDLKSLASTHIDELLKVWQGLGYYSRARNMHHTAQYLVNKNNGVFYSNYRDLIKLKGIGDYTASAIASISFNQATPVLDGNVYRVIARVYGIAESTQVKSGINKFKDILNKLITNKNPGNFNQAIMEFGALQCIPKNPDCNNCIIKSVCFAYNKGLVSDLPVKKQKVKQKVRYFNYLYIIYNENTFIEKRTEKDIWNSLYQFPLIETEKEYSLTELQKNKDWLQTFESLNPFIEKEVFTKKHILSHQVLVACFYKIRIIQTTDFLLNNYRSIPLTKLDTVSIPRLIEEYLEHINK